MIVDWITVAVSGGTSLVSAGLVLFGMKIDQARKEGKLGQQVQDHDEWLKCSNGKLSEQQKKDADLESELRAIKSRCESRESLWRRNNEDHVELFARVNALEKGQAAMPGEMAKIMDKRFEDWQKVLKRDIKATIYEIDREKERGK